jgi:hypothetical protein
VPGSDGGIPNPALPPATEVCCTVFFDAAETMPYENDPMTYTTPPAFNSDFSFIAFGNSGSRGTAFAEPPLFSDPAEVQDKLAAAMAARGADFYVVAGDMIIRNNVYNASTFMRKSIEAALNVEAVDHRFYNAYAALMCRAVFYTAPGDEDLEQRLSRIPDQPGFDFDGDYSAAYVMPRATSPSESNDGETEQF